MTRLFLSTLFTFLLLALLSGCATRPDPHADALYALAAQLGRVEDAVRTLAQSPPRPPLRYPATRP